jgi:hypothetical protein
MAEITSTPWDGRKIATPGMFSRVSISQYHGDLCAGPSISSSGLRKIQMKSCADFFDTCYLNPNRAEEPEQEYFILGRALHHLILGQPFFTKLFVIQPDEIVSKGVARSWHGNVKECRQWADTQTKMGLTILKPDQIEAIQGMAFSLGRDPLVRQGILNGLIERSLVYQDKETGVWVKARPDSFPKDSLDFVDIKTTMSVLPPDIASTIRKTAYHMQAALTRSAARAVFGLEMASFTFVFVQKVRPYSIAMVRLPNEDLDRGEQLNRIALRKFANCLRTQEWPGPIESGHVITLGLSADERARQDNIIERERGLAA